MTIPIGEQWVDERMRKLCHDYRRQQDGRWEDFPDYCPWSTNKDNLVHWTSCAECVAKSFIGIKGSFFKCPVEGWCEPDIKNILHNCLQKSLKNIDWLLHLSKKRYRDHASHQLFVGALGSFLLGCQVSAKPADGNGQTLKKWIANKLSMEENKVEVAWWISSLLHDHAYPLAHMLRGAPSLAGMDDDVRENLLNHTWSLLGFKSKIYCENSVIHGLYDSELLGKLLRAIQQTELEDRRRELYDTLKEYLSPFFPQAEELHQDPEDCYDHGILGAANLAALLRCSSQEDKILKAAIRAIGIHNGAACHESVSVEQDPLAFLLILCDEWQEWKRRIVVNDDAVYESKQILLEDVEESGNGKCMIGESLTAIFVYSDVDILKKTGWDYLHFSASKRKALDRLCVSDDFPIKRVKYRIQIPYEQRFSPSCKS